MTKEEMQARVKELDGLIQKQADENNRVYKSLPQPSRQDPRNEKAKPIMEKWYEGQAKIRALIDEQNDLREELCKLREPQPEQHKTFVNGFGEATTRYITSTTYERQQRRLDREIHARLSRRF